MAQEDVDRIEAALEPIAASHGFEVVAVELAGAKHRPLVRVLLDREGGVNLDDIASANGWISDVLDELDRPAGPYTLEVSSPGIERPLRKPEHFKRFVGQRAEVRTTVPHDGRRQYTGVIAAADDEAVTLDVDGTEVRLPYDDLSTARLRVEIDFKEEGSGKP